MEKSKRTLMACGFKSKAISIAVDGSDDSKRAIEFLAETIANSDCRMVLCSVLRDFELVNGKEDEKRTRDCIGATFEKIESIMESKIKYLQSVGIKRKDIVTKIIQGAKSRTAAIAEAAKEEKCGTIVFGRKGRSKVASFDIGRVPWKVINGAKKWRMWFCRL